MPLYTLITPASNTQEGCVSFDAANDTVAWYICLQLGCGTYMPIRGDGCEMYPSAGYNLYGTQEEADQWIQDTFGDIHRWKNHNQVEIIDAFDSFMYSKPEARDDTSSLLAKIAGTKTLGNTYAENVINTAREIATSLSKERQTELAEIEANKPSTNTLEFNRNFERPEYPLEEPIEALMFAQPVELCPPAWAVY